MLVRYDTARSYGSVLPKRVSYSTLSNEIKFERNQRNPAVLEFFGSRFWLWVGCNVPLEKDLAYRTQYGKVGRDLSDWHWYGSRYKFIGYRRCIGGCW